MGLISSNIKDLRPKNVKVARFAEPSSDGKDEILVEDSFEVQMNLHKNFVDISEDHRKLRTIRAHRMATLWLDVLGKDLKSLVVADKRQIYREQFQNGASLSLHEMQQLDSVSKQDYFNEIIKRDRNTTRKI